MTQTSSIDYQLSKKEPIAATPWFFWLSDKTLMADTRFYRVLRKIRRSYFSTFYPEYVRASIEANREGDCTRCGACCKLVYQCPFLGEDASNQPYCRIYGDLRPASCKSFPFDRVDSEIEECGFKFK